MILDHIVHFIDEEPKDAVAFWKERGFHSAIGGQHVDWGTHNALLYMKDCYIEWLAVEKAEIAQNAAHPLTRLLLHDRTGFGTICIRTAEIDALDKRLKRDGFETSGVLGANRKTADGRLIRWKMLFINETVSDRLPCPFFIQWEETDASRYVGLRATGAMDSSNEQLEIDRLVFGVRDVAGSEELFARLLGGSLQLANSRIEFEQTEHPRERLERVYFKEGKQRIEYADGVYYVPASRGVW